MFFSDFLWTNRCLCFCFFPWSSGCPSFPSLLGWGVGPSFSGSGLAFLLGYCPTPTIRRRVAARPKKKERKKAAPPQRRTAPKKRRVGKNFSCMGVWPSFLGLGCCPDFSASFLALGCHCFSYSGGRVDLPAWRWSWGRQYSFSGSATDRHHPTEERGENRFAQRRRRPSSTTQLKRGEKGATPRRITR